MADHRRVVLMVWAAVLLMCLAAFPVLERRLGGMDFSVRGSQSQQAAELASRYFPQLGSEQDVVVFQARTGTVDSPESRSAVGATVGAVQQVSGVVSATDPYGVPGQISQDRRVAIAVLGLEGDMTRRAATAAQVQKAVVSDGSGPVTASVTGYSPVQNDVTDIQRADLQRAEAIGLPIAVVLLALAFGAVAAALVPAAVALAGLLLAAGVLFALTGLMSFDTLVMSMATMIGVGVGIDYAMFIVSRFREELTRSEAGAPGERDRVAEAVGKAVATSGKTVLTSGVVVMISLCSLVVIDAPIFRAMTIGVAVAVVSTLAAGLTLLPALLATLRAGIDRGALPRRLRPAPVTSSVAPSRSRWGRWASMVMAHPALFGGTAVAVLVLAAAPLSGIRYGLDMGTAALGDSPAGRATAVLTENFPAGALSPVLIVASDPGGAALSADNDSRTEDFIERIGSDDRIETVLPVHRSDGRVLVTAIPAVAFDSARAETLVRDLRDLATEAGAEGGPRIAIGGSTAEFVDLADEMTSKLPWVIALVLATSLVFLVAAFRSVVLPLKAVAMNLLATGAALGLTVAVFQWGTAQSLLDFTSTGFVQVYLPTLVFAILFGLSMDYEVFLIRRMRESWEHSGDNRTAVITGLAHTARPITAAAAIMVAVFGSFLTADVLELKQIGFALAVAVTIDALLVRLVLVPALMRLFGRWNWWLPGRSGIKEKAPATQ